MKLAAVIGLLMLMACGDSPKVRALVQTVEGDTPFTNVARLDALVYRDNKLIARNAGDGIATLTLPEVEIDDGLTYYLAGLDAGGVLVASGTGAPRLADSGCCFTLCFCSELLVNNGSCGCGSDVCSAKSCP